MFDLTKSGEENLVAHLNLVNDLLNRVGQELTVEEASFFNVQPFGGNPPYNTQLMVDTRNPLVFGKGPVRIYYGRIDLAAAAAAVTLDVDPAAENVSDYLPAFNAATNLNLQDTDIVDAPITDGPVIIVPVSDNLIYTGRGVLVFEDGSHPLNTAIVTTNLNGLRGP